MFLPKKSSKTSKKKKERGGKPAWKDVTHSFFCTVNGAREINIENYGSLGDFSEKRIVLNCYKCKMIIEGEGLFIDYFTDIDMKITGRIHAIHF